MFHGVFVPAAVNETNFVAGVLRRTVLQRVRVPISSEGMSCQFLSPPSSSDRQFLPSFYTGEVGVHTNKVGLSWQAVLRGTVMPSDF